MNQQHRIRALGPGHILDLVDIPRRIQRRYNRPVCINIQLTLGQNQQIGLFRIEFKRY